MVPWLVLIAEQRAGSTRDLAVRQAATLWLSQGGRAVLVAPLCGAPSSQSSSHLMKGTHWNRSGELGKSCWEGNCNLSFRPKPLTLSSLSPSTVVRDR